MMPLLLWGFLTLVSAGDAERGVPVEILHPAREQKVRIPIDAEQANSREDEEKTPTGPLLKTQNSAYSVQSVDSFEVTESTKVVDARKERENHYNWMYMAVKSTFNDPTFLEKKRAIPTTNGYLDTCLQSNSCLYISCAIEALCQDDEIFRNDFGDLRAVAVAPSFHVSLRNESTGGILDFQGYMAHTDPDKGVDPRERMVHLPRMTPDGKHFYAKYGYHKGSVKYLFGGPYGVELKLQNSTLSPEAILGLIGNKNLTLQSVTGRHMDDEAIVSIMSNTNCWQDICSKSDLKVYFVNKNKLDNQWGCPSKGFWATLNQNYTNLRKGLNLNPGDSVYVRENHGLADFYVGGLACLKDTSRGGTGQLQEIVEIYDDGTITLKNFHGEKSSYPKNQLTVPQDYCVQIYAGGRQTQTILKSWLTPVKPKHCGGVDEKKYVKLLQEYFVKHYNRIKKMDEEWREIGLGQLRKALNDQIKRNNKETFEKEIVKWLKPYGWGSIVYVPKMKEMVRVVDVDMANLQVYVKPYGMTENHLKENGKATVLQDFHFLKKGEVCTVLKFDVKSTIENSAFVKIRNSKGEITYGVRKRLLRPVLQLPISQLGVFRRNARHA